MPTYKVKFLGEQGKLSGNTIEAKRLRIEDGVLCFDDNDGAIVAVYADGLWLSARKIGDTEGR